MSNKNLKVYKIQFITELKTLFLKVKFPCQIKMTWKRSNQSTQSKIVKLVDGQAVFNETLKLTVNMYFDTTKEKFVQKKCIYSFLIFTQKGEKSAGSVTLDLAQFFNKRIYQKDEMFELQKCPVKDTKVSMKIWYDQTTQGGYDSMSQISTSSQLDISTNPLDLSELNQSKDLSQKSNSTIQNNSKQPSKQLDSQQSQKTSKNQDNRQSQKYEVLDESDVESDRYKSQKVVDQLPIQQKKIYEPQPFKLSRPSQNSFNSSNKIGENIKQIDNVAGKINDFVSKFKNTMKIDIQDKKRIINQLKQELFASNELSKRLEVQLSQQKKLRAASQMQLSSLKNHNQTESSMNLQKISQLQRKLDQQRKNTSKLETRMNQLSSNKGQEQQNKNSYIKQLKQNFVQEESIYKKQIEQLRTELISQKKFRTNFQAKNKNLQQNFKQLNEKYDRLLDKFQKVNDDVKKRQNQLQSTRIKLDKAFQNLVGSLNGLMQ